MAERFVPLAERLRPPAPPPPLEASPSPRDAQATPAPEAAVAPDVAAAVRDARLFRAAVADALDAARERLLRDLAADVLARELRSEPADTAAAGAALLAAYAREEPVRLRVAPADARIACDIPITVDDGLAPGDAVLELREGSIDARLGVRLAAVLDRLP